MFDTGVGPILVREDFLSEGWEQHRRPLRVRFVITDANGRRITPTSAIALVIRMGKTQMRPTFLVVKHLEVPLLLGCAFARNNDRAILLIDDKTVLAAEETISFARRTAARGHLGRTRHARSFHARRSHRQRTGKPRPDRIKVARSRTIAPGESAAIWVSASSP